MEATTRQQSGIGPGTVLGNARFLVGERIGAGGFGEIFKAIDRFNNGQPIAVKVCRADNQRQLVTFNQQNAIANIPTVETVKFPEVCHWDLKVEYNVMSHMKNVKGFPKAYEIGTFQGDTYLAMELLGPSLLTVFGDKHCTFSIKTLLIILDQLLERLEMLHSKGIIHGDLTPDNILLGTGENSKLLYLIDFGLSSMFMDSKTGKHLPKRRVRSGACTPRYVSVSAQQGTLKSRRDDMVSLAYVMAQFTAHGQLPWDKFVGQRNFKEVENMKRNMKCEQLFDGFPREFAMFLELVQSLKYEEEPNYSEYRTMFRRLGATFGIVYDDGDAQTPLF